MAHEKSPPSNAPARPTVRLLPIDAALSEAVQSAGAAFERAYGVSLGGAAETVRGVVHQTLAMLARDPRPAPFGGFLVLDAVERQVVGTCGFASGPGESGEPEIAYFTFPAFERRGYAGAAALELIALARGFAGVRRIIAHTLPEANASTRILERSGFRCAGHVQHPEDGPVWRWELAIANGREPG